MDQTYNPHDGWPNFGRGLGRQTHYSDDRITEAYKQTFSYSGCKVTIHHETEPRGIFSDLHDYGSYTFNLCDIDPQSIKMHTFDSHTHKGDFVCADPEKVKLYQLNCDEAEVLFSTRNDAPAIDWDYVQIFERLQGADHELRSKSKESRAFFIVDDVQYAGRFAKAFRHAVELCGGKPSAFPETAAFPPDSTASSAQELFKRLAPSVFIVEALDASGSVVATGSGVALGSDEVVTNKHVIKEGKAWRIRRGRETWSASITHFDPDHDLCDLNSPGLNAPPVLVRASSSLAVGERVYAIGAPEGLELTLSEGVISGLRDYKGGRVIQTSAAISPGSSGGGLFDAEGRLVGITTFFLKEGQNLNFALPGEWVQGLAKHPFRPGDGIVTFDPSQIKPATPARPGQL